MAGRLVSVRTDTRNEINAERLSNIYIYSMSGTQLGYVCSSNLKDFLHSIQPQVHQSLFLMHQPPGRQQGEVAACQEGITLRSHPSSVEELVRELLLHRLAR